MNNKIYPLAYKLSPKQTCTLYYLGFPASWKATLLDIAQKNNPRFKKEYGLPTNALKDLIISWMEGVVNLAPLKEDSHDARWLTSCRKYSEEEIQALCDIIKVWVTATYVASSKTSPMVKKLAEDFCNTMNREELLALQTASEINLVNEDGTVCEEAYQAIPLLAVNRLVGKEITLSEKTLHLCYAAKNQLISKPIQDAETEHQYSFVFDLSVQTTPPKRKALLLCQMRIRRWIPGTYKKEKVPFWNEKMNAHIKISEDKYCKIPLFYENNKKQFVWKEQDMDCYKIWGDGQLSPAEEVVRNPAEHAKKILLPYKNGMRDFVTSKIGTGVSVIDKASLYQSISALLGDMVCEQPEAKRVTKRGQNFVKYSSPQEYEDAEKFRSWVHKCVGTDKIAFELYGLWKDESQQRLLNRIQDKIKQDFGEEKETSPLKIEYLHEEVGALADEIPNSGKQAQIKRCDEIVKRLRKTDKVTACIFVLPGREHYTKGDPKAALRNAFAKTGRVVQFITPDEDANQNKIENTVYDLYRQLGVVTLLGPEEKQPPFADVRCVGMHLCPKVQGISRDGKLLPIYVEVDLLEGQTQVHCDAFSNKKVSYREACLEMAQLFWKGDLEQRCANANRTPANQKLTELKNFYSEEQEKVLFLIKSDGNTRKVWSGISDKAIGGYEGGLYCPAEIDAGTFKSTKSLELAGSGVRIIRIRSNEEVPDYFTDLSKKSTDENFQLSSASGIFKYEDVFWGIHSKPNDNRYTYSFKESRINYPNHQYAEKDMIELYPLQLQKDDDAEDWIFYTNALRALPIQYNQSTVLPLPLHLAENLEEYLFQL